MPLKVTDTRASQQPAPPAGRCASCKYFRPWYAAEGDPRGICGKMSGYTAEQDLLAYPVADDDFGLRVIVLPMFGCVMHEDH